MGIKHAKQSGLPADDGISSHVQPTDWYADHDLSAIDITDIPTAETDTALVLHPDGAGGVEWGADATGGGGSTGWRYPVQDKQASNNNTSSQNVTMNSTPTNGNLLIIVTESEGAANVSSITQTNVTWTKVAESTASTTPHCEVWKGVVAASAGTSVTVAWGSSTYCCFHVSEWSGVTGTLDQSAVLTTQANQYLPIITPTSQTALVISGGAQSTYGSDFGAIACPVLLKFAGATMASAFGFPGTTAIGGAWPNSHGGTFSGVTVSLT
jgi:hypothetical protein